MEMREALTLKIHGLAVDNEAVRARVFVKKMRVLLSGLQVADAFANGRRHFDYLVTGLKAASAETTLRERRTARQQPMRSSVSTFLSATTSVYNADPAASRLPPRLLQLIAALGSGADDSFSHAELMGEDGEAIRIDDFFVKQSQTALEEAEAGARAQARHYRGVAVSSFDGVLKAVDLRGTVWRAKLVLTAGGTEIDCIVNSLAVPMIRDSLDRRIVVEGITHYDDNSQIPLRLDIKSAHIVREKPDLSRWRGMFQAPKAKLVEDEW